jgi:hypothetical protein
MSRLPSFNGFYWNWLKQPGLPPNWSCTRSTTATNGQYTDAAGQVYTTFAANQPVFCSQGIGVFESRTNYLLNSDSPATQTTGSLGTGYYVLFFNGTGTVTSSAGTATATGLGALSAGSFQVIDVTVAGTLTLTISGTVNWFDLQNAPNALSGGAGVAPAPHIHTAGATVTRSADSIVIGGTVAQILQNGVLSEVIEGYQLSPANNSGIRGANFHSLGLITNQNGTATNAAIYEAGNTAILNGSGAFGSLATNRIAAASKAGNYAVALGGAAATTGNNTFVVPQGSTFYLGFITNGQYFNGWVSQHAVYPYLLSPTALKNKSAVGALLP